MHESVPGFRGGDWPQSTVRGQSIGGCKLELSAFQIENFKNFQFTTSNTLRVTASSSPAALDKPAAIGIPSMAGQAFPTTLHRRLGRACRSRRRLARQ